VSGTRSSFPSLAPKEKAQGSGRDLVKEKENSADRKIINGRICLLFFPLFLTGEKGKRRLVRNRKQKIIDPKSIHFPLFPVSNQLLLFLPFPWSLQATGKGREEMDENEISIFIF
jgi:hypothetical protein